MSPNKSQIKFRERAACDGAVKAEARAISRCPHCGQSLAWAPEPERIRWYIADDAPRARVSALGAKLLDALQANGQAVYVSEDGGKTMRRVGIATAASGERIPPEEREPIILTPEEFQRYWRQAAAPKPRTFSAGGAR